jgi:hypothetical protein
VVTAGAPLTPISFDTLTQTVAAQPAPRLCCHCAEGVFGAIWQADSVIRDKLDSISAPNPHHPLVAFTIDTAYEPFEHGAMVWAPIGLFGTPMVYVLHGDGSFQMFYDTFDLATDPVSGGETPPAGLREPALGFGKVWREQPGVRQALGWATAGETGGKGRSQTFYQGSMVWLSQRKETYVFMSDEPNSWAGSYVVVDSPSFDIPAPKPRGDAALLIQGRWVDGNLGAGDPAAAGELAFSPDGSITFRDCAGRYELSGGNRILISWEACASPDPLAGGYEFSLGAAGDVLVLSQRFQEKMPLTGGGDVWSRKGPAHEIGRAGGGMWIPNQCDGTVDYLDNCNIQLKWTDCAMVPRPLAATRYEYTIVGYELSLNRYFTRVN